MVITADKSAEQQNVSYSEVGSEYRAEWDAEDERDKMGKRERSVMCWVVQNTRADASQTAHQRRREAYDPDKIVNADASV